MPGDNDSQLTLQDIPDDVLGLIAHQLSNSDLSRLSRTCHLFHNRTAVDRLLRQAASGTQADIDGVIEMVKANPELLLQKGNVMTRGGTKIINTTVYEFFLGSGHAEALEAMHRENLFGLLPDGEAKRVLQYEQYKPHIEQLKADFEAYDSAYDPADYAPNPAANPSYHLIKPLINIIRQASPPDVKAELNQTPQPAGEETRLRQAMEEFRKVIDESQKVITTGVHYLHYTTIMLVLDLLYEKWDELSVNDTNYDKCQLVFSQIFGYLQRPLPVRERMAFARAFADSVLSLEYNYQSGHRFPDVDFSHLVRSGLGFSFCIVGRGRPQAGWPVAAADRFSLSFYGSGDFKSHVEQKLETLGSYAQAADRDDSARMRTSLR